MAEAELPAAKPGGIGHWVDCGPGVFEVDTRSPIPRGREGLLEIGKRVLYSAEVLVGFPDRG